MKEIIMKTKSKISRFLAISTLVLSIPMTAFAYGNDHGGRDGRGGSGSATYHGQGMTSLRGIDLNTAQTAQLTNLREEQKKLSTEMNKALHDQRDALHKLVLSETYTPTAAAEIITKMGGTRTEMAMLDAEQNNKRYKLLTPEQRTKLQQNELMGQGMRGRGRKG